MRKTIRGGGSRKSKVKDEFGEAIFPSSPPFEINMVVLDIRPPDIRPINK